MKPLNPALPRLVEHLAKSLRVPTSLKMMLFICSPDLETACAKTLADADAIPVLTDYLGELSRRTTKLPQIFSDAKPLTQDALDREPCPKCGRTDCDDGTPGIFKSRCHPAAAVTVSYVRHSGRLTISCAECATLVCEISVA